MKAHNNYFHYTKLKLISLAASIAAATMFFSPIDLQQYSAYSNYIISFLCLIPFIFLYKKYKVKGIFLFILLAILGILIEMFGVATGILYGNFSYNDFFDQKIFGLVPWSVGCVWAALVISSSSVTSSLHQKASIRVVYATAFLVGFDMVFDPVAVRLGFWSWENGGIYYGVPIHNFLGWVVASVISLSLLELFKKRFDIVWCSTNLPLFFFYFFSFMMWWILAFLYQFWIPVCIGFVLIFAIFWIMRPKLDKSMKKV